MLISVQEYKLLIKIVMKIFKLLNKVNELKNIPMLINTSFNVRGEPIVCTPFDAYRCFMGTDIDILVIQNLILIKDEQTNSTIAKSYVNDFSLD